MSYRELRNFKEIMCTLGYPRLISIENFKARVKLNLKNLYSSNGFAVRELLKIATLLHDAHKNSAIEEGDDTLPADIGPGHKFADVKLTRSLAADITKYGARLHELLGRHAEAKEGAA